MTPRPPSRLEFIGTKKKRRSEGGQGGGGGGGCCRHSQWHRDAFTDAMFFMPLLIFLWLLFVLLAWACRRVRTYSLAPPAVGTQRRVVTGRGQKKKKKTTPDHRRPASIISGFIVQERPRKLRMCLGSLRISKRPAVLWGEAERGGAWRGVERLETTIALITIPCNEHQASGASTSNYVPH